VRHFGQVVDKGHASAAEVRDHVLVVDDFVINKDRWRERRQRQIERLDRHVDAGTKSTRTGQKNLHAIMIVGQPKIGQADAYIADPSWIGGMVLAIKRNTVTLPARMAGLCVESLRATYFGRRRTRLLRASSVNSGRFDG
jgi:HAMP domain-containing protein